MKPACLPANANARAQQAGLPVGRQGRSKLRTHKGMFIGSGR